MRRRLRQNVNFSMAIPKGQAEVTLGTEREILRLFWGLTSTRPSHFSPRSYVIGTQQESTSSDPLCSKLKREIITILKLNLNSLTELWRLVHIHKPQRLVQHGGRCVYTTVITNCCLKISCQHHICHSIMHELCMLSILAIQTQWMITRSQTLH